MAPGVGRLGFGLAGRVDSELVAGVLVGVVVPVVGRVVRGRVDGHGRRIRQTDLRQVSRLPGDVRSAGPEPAGPGRVRGLHDTARLGAPGAEPVDGR